MTKDVCAKTARYFKSLSRYDNWLIGGLVMIFLLNVIVDIYTAYRDETWFDFSCLSSVINSCNAHVISVYAAFLLTVSTLIRHVTNGTKNNSWRYMAIMAFSVVGSVVVALITDNEPLEEPFLCALTFSLIHFGYWCWQREHIEASTYQDQMRTTTNTLERILNTMPKEDAFRVMGENTASIFNMLYMITSMAQAAKSDEQKKAVANKAKEQIKNALSSMSQIASLWTVSSARLFEANIMLVISSDRAAEIPDAETAFKRGQFFFPDALTLDTLHLGCEKCLYVATELAINTHAENGAATVEPLMLPVGLKSTTHPGLIKGAPEAVEKKRVISIKEVSEIIENLPGNYVNVQKQKIQEYFNGQEKCGSILSIPLIIKELNGHSGTPATMADESVDAVINLYRPEQGLIKSPELFQEFTRPLVQMIANLLYLYMENVKILDTPVQLSLEKTEDDKNV